MCYFDKTLTLKRNPNRRLYSLSASVSGLKFISWLFPRVTAYERYVNVRYIYHASYHSGCLHPSSALQLTSQFNRMEPLSLLPISSVSILDDVSHKGRSQSPTSIGTLKPVPITPVELMAILREKSMTAMT